MFKRNLFYNIILSLSQFIFPLLSFPYAARILGPGGFGAVNFIDSFTGYFILFAALGIPIYGLREVAKVKDNKKELDKIFNELLVIHIFSTALFSIIYLVLIFSIPEVRNYAPLALTGVGIMFLSIFSIEWFFQGTEQFAYITKRSVIVRFASLILLFAILKPGDPPLYYYLINASVFLLNGFSNFFYVSKIVKINFAIDFSLLKRHVRPIITILGSSLAVSVYILMDNVILGFIKDETSVGIYSTATRIVKVPFALITAISTIIIPSLSRAFIKQDAAEVNALINKSFTFISIVSIPIAIGMYICANFIVISFAGNEFVKSVAVFEILAPINIIVGLNCIFGTQILMSTGKEKHFLKSVFLGMVFSLICNLFLIPLYSAVGAAVTNLLTEIVVTILCFYFATNSVKFKIAYKIFFQCLLGGLMFFPIAFFVRKLPVGYVYQETLTIISCAICYFLYLLLFIKNSYIESLKIIISSRLGLR